MGHPANQNYSVYCNDCNGTFEYHHDRLGIETILCYWAIWGSEDVQVQPLA